MVAIKKKRRRAGSALLGQLANQDRDGFAAWVVQHLEWMEIHNYSKMTRKQRELVLVRFSSWCSMRGIDKPRDVTKPILERYQKHLYEHRKADATPLCFASQANMMSNLRCFFAWMARQNALLWNPASEIQLPRVSDRIPRAVLTIAEVEEVLAQIDVTTTYGVRDRAMVETLYSTGIRRSELLSLDLSDLDGERGMLLVREGKGKKDRMLPIGVRAVQWIDKYLAEARPEFLVDTKQVALFLNHRGERLDAGGLTPRVRGYVKAANIGKTGSCHLFRHTMATLMLEGGADVRFIQQMLGHASLESTEIYTRVSIRMLKAVHEATHPARLTMQKDAGAGESTKNPAVAAGEADALGGGPDDLDALDDLDEGDDDDDYDDLERA